MAEGDPRLRLARRDEADAVDALMKAAIAELFPHFHTPAETAAAVEYIGSVDRMLIEDGTYFVAEDPRTGELVACGGWSKRDKLYTGSGDADGDARLLDPATEPARVRAMFVRQAWTRRGLGTAIIEASEAAAKAAGFTELALMATLPGEPLYRRCGFTEVERVVIPLPNGMELGGVAMRRPVR